MSFVIIANGALHHLSNLEGVFEGIRHTLKPNGLLYACDYVGPSYQDHSARQLQLINAAAFLVPSELRDRKGQLFFKNERIFRFISKLYAVASRNAKLEWPYWKKMIHLTLKGLLNRNHKDFDFGIVHISSKDNLHRHRECVHNSKKIMIFASVHPLHYFYCQFLDLGRESPVRRFLLSWCL